LGTDEPRRFSREFKLEVLRRMEAGENVSVLARELGVSRKSIYKWRERYRLGGSLALRIRGRTTSAEASAMKMHQTKPPEGNSSPDNPPSLEEQYFSGLQGQDGAGICALGDRSRCGAGGCARHPRQASQFVSDRSFGKYFARRLATAKKMTMVNTTTMVVMTSRRQTAARNRVCPLP
jgi:transposase-like protein